jgi:hypothetical protein
MVLIVARQLMPEIISTTIYKYFSLNNKDTNKPDAIVSCHVMRMTHDTDRQSNTEWGR